VSNKFTNKEIAKFIKIVFEIIDNNKNVGKSKKVDLIRKEIERRVKR